MVILIWLVILSCLKLSFGEKVVGSVNITLTEWKYVSEHIEREVRQSSANRGSVDQEQCNSVFETSHHQHTHQKLPCTLGPGLAWVRPPPHVGAGRAGHLSHWSPVQVKAQRCRGACHIHLDPEKNKKREMMGNEIGTLPLDSIAFDAEEIKRLGKRFKKLDLDGSGSLSIEEFMSLPELQQNPLVRRVIDIFDDDGNGEVDFKEFIQGLSHFSAKGDMESKLRFAFRIYDMDNDGYISNGELYQVLKMISGDNLKDTQLQQIVDKAIIMFDKDEKGKLNFAEFCEVVGNTDVHTKMVVKV